MKALKTKEIGIALSSESIKLVKSIIKTENLTISYSIEEDTMGDTNIVLKGLTQQINLFNEIYVMVGGK